MNLRLLATIAAAAPPEESLTGGKPLHYVKRLDHPAAPAQSIAPRCNIFTAQPHQIPPLAPLKTAHLGRPVQWRGDFPALGDSPTTPPPPGKPPHFASDDTGHPAQGPLLPVFCDRQPVALGRGRD